MGIRQSAEEGPPQVVVLFISMGFIFCSAEHLYKVDVWFSEALVVIYLDFTYGFFFPFWSLVWPEEDSYKCFKKNLGEDQYVNFSMLLKTTLKYEFLRSY